MSYILEALRKAEQERNLGRVPDLQTAPLPMPQTKRRLWPFLLGLVLVINGVALALFWWPDYGSRLFVTDKPAAFETQPVSPPQQAVVTRPVVAVATKPTPPTPVPVQPAQSVLQPPSTLGVAVPPPAPPPNPLPATSSAPRQHSAPPVERTAIALQALPITFRRSVPRLNLDVHVYSAADRKRFVMINSKRYQEGDRLTEGPLLESITADGAVLFYRGQRFLLPVYQ